MKLNINSIQDRFPTWETVEQEVPHRSVLCPLHLIVSISDVPESIKHTSEVMLFADDTNGLITNRDYNNFKQKINFALSCVNKWFQANLLGWNIEKTKFVKFTPKHSVHVPLAIGCADEFIEETWNTSVYENR